MKASNVGPNVHQLHLLLPTEEWETLRRMADDEYLSVTNLVRWLVYREAARRERAMLAPVGKWGWRGTLGDRKKADLLRWAAKARVGAK